MILQVLRTQDEGKVEEQFLKMIHSLFLQVFVIYWVMCKHCFPLQCNKIAKGCCAQWINKTENYYRQVESFLMNPTFTSKGGFKIMINGITFFQVRFLFIL